MCNLYGSIETVKRKLTILKEHWTGVGSDYGSILKTKLGIISMKNDKETKEKLIKLTYLEKIVSNKIRVDNKYPILISY
jgi:hypothetical protein